MRVQDIVMQLRMGKDLTEEQKQFIINRWQCEPIVKSEKFGSYRCPNCDAVVTYMNAHYCIQCGQRIVTHW